MLLKFNLELSIGKHLEVQFSARMWELSQIFFDWAIQDIIATIILSLKLAEDLFEKSWPITSPEFSTPDITDHESISVYSDRRSIYKSYIYRIKVCSIR